MRDQAYQDRMQDVMIRDQARRRANAKEWLRRAQRAESEAALSRESLSEAWDTCDRSILLGQVVRLEALANNLRNKAADELRGLQMNLGQGEGNENEAQEETILRAA